MSVLKISVVMAVGACVAAPLVWNMQSAERREQITALLPEKIRPIDLDDLSTKKITVYQSQGNKGETVFSDRQNMTRTAHARVVDNAKGTTTHMETPQKEEKSSSMFNVNEDSARFQQQAQAIQQARMERAIGE